MATAEQTPGIPSQTPSITLRQPSTSSSPSPSDDAPALTPPPLDWLSGSWNVTHSTLPMWRKSRNVRITYTPLFPAGSGHVSGRHIDDVVSYQPLDKSKSKISTVHGVDKPLLSSPTSESAAPDSDERAAWGYTWRGKGWLVIASSKWEILGYGDEEETGNSWVVTYFAKTLFTPAGVDVYSRKALLRAETVRGIQEAIKGLGGDVAKLGGEVFEVAYDGEREGKA